MSNPCNIIPELTGISPNIGVREETPTILEFNRLIITCVVVNAPQRLIDLFSAVWESGLRIGEMLSWKVEDICLEIVRDEEGKITDVPYFTTLITKQRRPARKQIPMSFGLCEILKRVIGERTGGRVWPVECPP